MKIFYSFKYEKYIHWNFFKFWVQTFLYVFNGFNMKRLENFLKGKMHLIITILLFNICGNFTLLSIYKNCQMMNAFYRGNIRPFTVISIPNYYIFLARVLNERWNTRWSPIIAPMKWCIQILHLHRHEMPFFCGWFLATH